MCVRLSSPRKLVLRTGLNGEVALHDVATGARLAGQRKVELPQEHGRPARLVVTFEVGSEVTLGDRAMVRGESGPELEVTGPSRIYERSQAAALFAGSQDKGALEPLEAIAKHAAAISKRIEHWERNGMPGDRLLGDEHTSNGVR